MKHIFIRIVSHVDSFLTQRQTRTLGNGLFVIYDCLLIYLLGDAVTVNHFQFHRFVLPISRFALVISSFALLMSSFALLISSFALAISLFYTDWDKLTCSQPIRMQKLLPLYYLHVNLVLIYNPYCPDQEYKTYVFFF